METIMRTKIVGREPGNILAQQFRDIVVELGLASSLEILIDLRVAELKTNKGAINAKVKSENMSFSMFIDNLVNILKIDDLSFTTVCRVKKIEAITTQKIKIVKG